MAKLLESDFLTVNLSSVFKNNTNINTTQPAVKSERDTSSTNEQPITDWNKELESRLEANNKLNAEARESEYDIETKFFEEYFKANWKDPAVVKQLMLIGEPLKKAIKILKFDKTVNPILAFVSDDYFIESLIKTKLLNASTFKAIYNAVAKKLVAHSQFLASNDYNIIYCPDLYKRSAEEILKYLDIQDDILSATASKYTKADLEKNKKVLLSIINEENFSQKLIKLNKADVSNISVKTAILNSIDLAKQLQYELSKADTTGTVAKAKAAPEAQRQLAQRLNTPAKKLAAIQYIGMTTESTKAKEALNSDLFNKVSGKELMTATLNIANKLPKGTMSTKDADSLIELILGDM